jgi:hypothetical protein
MTACKRMGGRRRKTRKMRGGNLPSFGGTIGTAGPVYGSANLSGGDVKVETMESVSGGRRRRSRGRRSRRTRRRTMRGGALQSANSAGGFTGSGVGGMIDLTPYAPNQGGIRVASA